MRSYRLSPLAVIAIVMFLAFGELASGTDLNFVAMMSVGVFSACLTYNLLGGIRTIGGLAFAVFALKTLVISQIAKVLLLQPADQNLRVPQLTIAVYAVFFFCVMVGTAAFGKVRLPLLKPSEPETSAQFQRMYILSLIGGTVGVLEVALMSLQGGNAEESMGHGVARALAYLLPFALVLAVDERIRVTGGRSCVGWKVVWPALGLAFFGFQMTSRGGFMEPLVIIIITAFFRGFRFRWFHYAGMAGVAVAFVLFISPIYLYARGFLGDEASLQEKVVKIARVMETAPSNWTAAKDAAAQGLIGNPNNGSYFPEAKLSLLNRFALIGSDSTLIQACSRGYHYGFTALDLDFRTQMPRFIVSNKPEVGSNSFLGHLDGMEPDQFETTNSTITSIPDSYGAFGWLGVAAFATLIIPLIFIVFESIFEMTRPWGTVATVALVVGFTEGGMGDKIAVTMIRIPTYIVVISILVSFVVRALPASADRSFAANPEIAPVAN